MATVLLNVTVRKRWILRQGRAGALVALIAMKLGAPSDWFFVVEVG